MSLRKPALFDRSEGSFSLRRLGQLERGETKRSDPEVGTFDGLVEKLRVMVPELLWQKSCRGAGISLPYVAIDMHQDVAGAKRHADMAFHGGRGQALNQLVELARAM